MMPQEMKGAGSNLTSLSPYFHITNLRILTKTVQVASFTIPPMHSIWMIPFSTLLHVPHKFIIFGMLMPYV